MRLAHIADRIATDIYTRPIDHEVRLSAVIRDACDQATYSDLPCSTLDRLADMVERRLNGDRFARWRLDLALQR
jgi:hypothetical protein